MRLVRERADAAVTPEEETQLRAELADLRVQVATLRRLNDYLRSDVKALGQRRDTIRREAEQGLMRALCLSERPVLAV